MACLLVQHSVNDYVEWKKGFDEAADFRTDSGVRSSLALQEADDPNMVTVLLEWDSLNQAREFADSPRLKDAMGRSGVQGVPCFYFLNEA